MLNFCLQAVLTSSAYVDALSSGRKHVHVRTYGLTKNYSPLISPLTFRIAHRGAGKFLRCEGEKRQAAACR